MKQQTIQGICMDLGDTLIDNSPFKKKKWITAYINFLGEKGKKIKFEQYQKDYHNILKTELNKKNTEIHEYGFFLKKLAKKYKINATAKELEHFDRKKWREITEECNLFPEAIEVLDKLKKENKRIFLITNAHKPKVDYILENKKISQFFDFVIASHEIKQPKSTGMLFKIALQKSGLKPSQLIVVGDKTEEDIKGAKKAGIKGILLKREGKGDIKNLRELLPIIGIAR